MTTPAVGQWVIKRLESLQSQRSAHESLWSDCYKYTYPHRGVQFSTGSHDPGTNAQTGAAQQGRLYDTTLTDSAGLLASAIMGGLAPQNQQWFEFSLGDWAAESTRGRWAQPWALDAQRWAQEAARTLWLNLVDSNFSIEGLLAILDVVVAGWGALYIEEAASGGLAFESWPLWTVYAACSRRGGPTDTFFRVLGLTAEQAVEAFGKDNLPENIRAKYDTPAGRDERFEFIHAIYPRSGAPEQGRFALNMPFASTWVERMKQQTVRESGYHECPVIFPTWLKLPNSPYATSPTADALPDEKTLCKLVEFTLANADLAVAGMWLGVDDGVLNPRALKIGPRKVIAAASKDALTALQPATKFDVAALQVDRLERKIRKIMYSTQLEPTAGPMKTATQANIDTALVRQALGPRFGLFQSTLLDPMMTRVFGLGWRANVFSEPPRSIQGRPMGFRWLAPLARAQAMEDVHAMDQFEMRLLNQVQAGRADVADVYDFDVANREACQKLGVPLKVLRDEDSVRKIRDIRADELKKQQQAALQQQMTMEAVKKAGGQQGQAGLMGTA